MHAQESRKIFQIFLSVTREIPKRDTMYVRTHVLAAIWTLISCLALIRSAIIQKVVFVAKNTNIQRSNEVSLTAELNKLRTAVGEKCA